MMNNRKYLRFLKDKSEETINTFLGENGISSQIEDPTALREGLENRLRVICGSSLDTLFLERIITEGAFSAFIKDENSPEIQAIDEKFYRELSGDERKVLATENQKLQRAFDLGISQYCSFLKEFFERFTTDRKRIEASFFNGSNCGKIKRLDPGKGDVHNHGRTTMIVETEAGKFVYKPHDVSIDAWIKVFFDTFFPQITEIPDTVCGDGCGFCRFVENTPAKTGRTAGAYYENLGRLCAVLTIIGSRDLHIENLLSDGTHPIPIDLEMIVSPMADRDENAVLANTILSTCLMPYRIQGKTESSLLFSKERINSSAPVINGKTATVLKYPKEFLRGFQDGYQQFLLQKPEIEAFVRQMPAVNVRYILRNTNAYANLINKVFTYQWLADGDVEKSVAESLRAGYDKAGQAEPAIIRSETDSVLEANVPYFYTKSDSHDLFDGNGPVKTGFFTRSCIQSLTENTIQASQEKLALELSIIKASFRRVKRYGKKGSPEEYDSSKQADYLNTAEDLFMKIMSEKMEDPDGQLFWFSIDAEGHSSMVPMTEGFVSGTLGIAAFASALSCVTENPEIKQQALRTCNRILAQVLNRLNSLSGQEWIFENQLSVGFSNGIAGMFHANELIDAYTGSDLCGRLREKLLSLLPKINTDFAGSDLMNGLAGLVKVLCQHENLFQSPGVSEIVSGYCDILLSKRVPLFRNMLLWDCLGIHRALSGAAHGQVGIAGALDLAGKKLGRGDLISAAKAGYEFEDVIYSERIGSWPDFRKTGRSGSAMHGYCSGAPGIGFEMLDLKTSVGKRNVERAVACCLKHAFLKRDIVCCGNCASIDFLLSAGLIEEARKRMNGVISHAEKHGFTFSYGGFAGIFETNLFHGAAGVGYECLRCLSPGKVKTLYI